MKLAPLLVLASTLGAATAVNLEGIYNFKLKAPLIYHHNIFTTAEVWDPSCWATLIGAFGDLGYYLIIRIIWFFWFFISYDYLQSLVYSACTYKQAM